MNIKNSQHGSAHAIIIVLLVIALLGALGFVFYQNFMVPKPEVHQEQAKVEENKSVITSLAFNSDIYEIDQPDDWETVIDKQQAPLQSVATVTSPSGEVKLTLSVSEGGLGGACDPSSPLKVRFYNVGTNAITKLGKTKAYLVEAITDAEGGGYNYKVGLTEDGGETHAAVGDSFCTVAYVGLASRMIVDNTKNVIEQPTVFAKVEFPKIVDAETGKLKEMQPLKDALTSDEYKEAVQILESARKK